MSTRQVVFGTKGVRSFGDGMMSIGLAQYADAIGLSGLQAGLVATSALVGTSLMTWLVGQYVERIGRRRMLIWAAFLAIATGLAYAASSSLAVLLGVAFIGTVNPTSGDVSSFLPIEQAILAQESEARTRVNVFARFSMVGSLAGALGALASGATVLFDNLPGVGTLGAIRLLFVIYSALGVGTLLLTLRLTPAAELVKTEKRSGLGPSKRKVYTLSALFATDAFAGGLVVQSIIALFLLRKFDLDPAQTGAVFFGTSLFSAISFLISSRLSMRYGLVNTMVFTHLPSNLLLVGVAFAPGVGFAVAFLMARSILSQMDVPPRQALIVGVVEPEERAATAAVTGLSRSIASAGAPTVGGALLGTSFAGLPFLVCGGLKSTYDLALWALFRKVEVK
ncbi:MAG: MFS transporter [Anaerolinea sp.]|nr:MFS transporter [Anaerolinea sp.]